MTEPRHRWKTPTSGSWSRNADGWLTDTRTSYDTVAVSYADYIRDALAGEPYLPAALALFADMCSTRWRQSPMRSTVRRHG